MRVGNRELDLSTPVVMAIINVTPDSFYSGSRLASRRQIAAAVDRAVEQGASILDVGGYSSRPGAADVSPEEEFRRLSLALEVIAGRTPGIPWSVDTFRADVARRCIEGFGPCIVNDISAGELDPEMLATVAEHNVPYIAMHMRATPADMQRHTLYGDVTEEVKSFFRSKIARMKDAGIPGQNIILDPGFGFAKTTAQNYQLLRRMDELLEFGCPILSGISRKSMIYKVLETHPADALTGTIALNWESLRAGASILRVHDTREAVEVVRLFDYYKKA